MKNSYENHPGNSAPEDEAQDNVRSRGGQKMRGMVTNPGGGGSQERIPAKGNDLTHEEYLLENDIAKEIDDALDEDQDR